MSGRDPFDQIERVFEEFGDLAGEGLAVDVVERSDVIEVIADLPGYNREDVDVRLHDDGRLEITATRQTATEADEGTVHRRERRRQSIERTVTLPAPVDPEGTQASLSNGVLTVRLEKRTTDDEGTAIDVT
ncbi:MAG: Hsp20/alpha crystallin family protein [Salinirussus sp.]